MSAPSPHSHIHAHTAYYTIYMYTDYVRLIFLAIIYECLVYYMLAGSGVDLKRKYLYFFTIFIKPLQNTSDILPLPFHVYNLIYDLLLYTEIIKHINICITTFYYTYESYLNFDFMIVSALNTIKPTEKKPAHSAVSLKISYDGIGACVPKK